MVGIEHFRALTTKTDLENRRVTVDQDLQEIRAPNSLKGRIINWIKGTHVGEVRAQENKEARLAFYNALVKAEGSKEFAEAVIKRVFGMDGEQFVARETNLQASKIKKALSVAGEFRRDFRLGNERVLNQYISNGNLGSVVETMARGKFSMLGHPGLKRDDQDVRREFRNLVRMDPDYRHRNFTRDELDSIAQKAVERACESKKARFDEQYPELAKIDTPHFHDSETFFTQLGRHAEDPWMDNVLSSLKDSTELLGEMSFDRTRASGLRDDTVRYRDQLKDMRDGSPETRYETAHDDLVQRLALEALENFPVPGNYPDHIQQLVKNFANQALSELSKNQSIEDPEVRKQLVDDVCTALDRELLGLMAPDLVEGMRKLQSDGRKISESDIPDREDQLRRIDEDIKKIYEQIVDSTKDQRQQIIQGYREKFESRLTSDPELETLPQLRKLDELQYRLERECDNQIAKLDSKIEYLTNYLNQDPRGETSFVHDKLIWAKATVSVLERQRDRIAKERDELVGLYHSRQNGDLLTDEQERLLQGYDGKLLAFGNQLEFLGDKIDLARARVTECEEDILTTARVLDGDNTILLIEEIGDEPEFDPKAQRTRLKQHRNDEVEYLRSLVSEGANLSLSRAGLVLDEARERVLSNPESITPIRRDMVVTRDGVTRTYRSENIPGGGEVLEGEWSVIENWAKEQGYPESAFRVPSLQVSQLKQVVSKTDDDNVTQEEVIKSQIIRHGVIEGFDIEDPELRERVGIMQAKQVLTLGVNLAPREFLVEARRRGEEQEPRSKFVHVNIALSTSDPSGRHLDRRDGELIQHQIDQFDRYRGENLLMIRFNGNELEQPEDDSGDGLVQIVSDHKPVDFDIDPITFSFTVSGKGTGTRFDEHDKQNMIKLVGDLAVGTAPGGYVGGVVDALQAKRDQPETSDTEKQQIDDMLGKIRREVDTARELFTSGAYKDVSVDPYKMARTVMRVVDLAGEGLRLSGDHSMHMSLSEGCRTNLEGAGKLDIEHKSQVIIEDMGGRVQPMQLERGGGLNDQDRIIYNTVLTGSGDTEVRGQRTGLHGLGDMRDISTRSRDIEALTYTSGVGNPNRR